MKSKLDAGKLSQEEYDHILSTHELLDEEDEYIDVVDNIPTASENSEVSLTLQDLDHLHSEDQVWLLSQVKDSELSVNHAIALAKEGIPSFVKGYDYHSS